VAIKERGDARAVLGEMRARKEKMPGFGHPIHKPVDPRAERILALATERGLDGAHIGIARELPALVAEIWGRPMPMNVSMPIAAVLLDLEFPPAMLKAIPILGRTASLLAHLAEEQQKPIGFLMASKGDEAITYERGEG
jgi:citrate synthase